MLEEMDIITDGENLTGHHCCATLAAQAVQAIPIFSPRHLHNFSTSPLYTRNGDFNGKCKSQPPVAQ
jgi:hypothetical protein